MNTLAMLKPLAARLLDIQRINSAASVLSWDQETYMPAGGGAARADQISTLQGLAHRQLIARETEQLLCRWVDRDSGHLIEVDGEHWDEPSRALLREVWRDFNRASKLPSEFVIRLSRECSLAQQVWVEAREDKSTSIHFCRVCGPYSALKREEAEYTRLQRFPLQCSTDTYEPDLTIASRDHCSIRLRSRLVPLLQAIAASSTKIDDSFLYHSYDTRTPGRIRPSHPHGDGIRLRARSARPVGSSFYHVFPPDGCTGHDPRIPNTNCLPACSVVSMKAGMGCMTRG